MRIVDSTLLGLNPASCTSARGQQRMCGGMGLCSINAMCSRVGSTWHVHFRLSSPFMMPLLHHGLQ